MQHPCLNCKKGDRVRGKKDAAIEYRGHRATVRAKKDRENIAPDELAAFKKLAKDYGSASDVKITALLNDKELLEICHDN